MIGEGPPDLVALVEAYQRTFNERDIDGYAALLDPEIEIEIDALSLRGIDEAVGLVRQVKEAFPGIGSETARIVATTEDTVVCETRTINQNADPADPAAWYLEGMACQIFEFRGSRVARLRVYYAPSPNDRTRRTGVPGRVEAAQMADERAALHRVATCVAEGGEPHAVFNAATREVAELLDAPTVALARYDEPSATVTVLAASGHTPHVQAGLRFPLAGTNVTSEVLRTGATARQDGFRQADGPIAEAARQAGVQSTVGAPVVVEGRTWGVLAASWADRVAPEDAEQRMTGFATLLGTAIANADARDQLTASRARVLAAADEARRRVVRDLHDGAQQRLVHTILTLKLAQRALENEPATAPALVAEGLKNAERANAELRELAHGILPSVLSRGLRAALIALVARLDLLVDIDVSTPPLPADVEANAYFITAEALTNVVKHASATRAWVSAQVQGGSLRLEVRDDGVGGADPRGPGLTGIADRIDAVGGRLQIESERGTTLAAELPLTGEAGEPPAGTARVGPAANRP